MGYSNIFDAVDIINNRVEPYDGHRVYLDTGGLQINKIEDIREFDFESKPSRANQNVHIHDIILARMKGTIKVKVISAEESDFMVSTGFIVLRAKQNVSDINFLNHVFLSDMFQRDKDELCTGATQKAINNTNFKKLRIYLPPLDQQKKIAAILDAADAYRQKTKALIEKYDALTQSLFLDMFGDPVTNPKGWLKLKLSEFCEFENGDRSSNYPSGNDIKSSGKLFLSSGDIKNGRFIVKDSKFISYEKFQSLKRGKCKTGDVLMTLRGNGTGKTAVFECEYVEGFINAQMVIIRPDGRCLSDYLVLQLNCPPVFKRLINLNSGSAQPQLSATNVKEFEVFVPDIGLQIQFRDRVRAIETQKAQAQQELDKADELFNSLLQKAFKGELKYK